LKRVVFGEVEMIPEGKRVDKGKGKAGEEE